MPIPPDKPQRPASTDGVTQRFFATLVGLLLGYIVGDMSGTVAKLFLFIRKSNQYQPWQLTETSLAIILVFTCVIAIFGVYSTKRGWANEDQVVLSVASALLIAVSTIIDQSLPEPNGDGDLLIFFKQFHFIGWMFGLWLIPIILLPNPSGSSGTKIQLGGRLIALSAALALVCGIVGLGLTQFFRLDVIEKSHYLKSIWSSSNCNICSDSLGFWMMRPFSLNPIWGIFFVMAFLPIWRQELWENVKISFARVWWVVFAVIFATLYSGLYGWKLYTYDRNWARCLMDSNLISELYFFFAFGAFPTAGALVVLFCYWLTRRKESVNKADWPVSNLFWWLLPLGFAISFAAIAGLFIVPIIRADHASDIQINFLTISHAINGAVLGLTLLVFIPARRILFSGRYVESRSH